MKNFFPPVFAKPIFAVVAMLIAFAQHPAASTAVAQIIVQVPEANQAVKPVPVKRLEPLGQLKPLEKAATKPASTYAKRRALIVCGTAGDEDYLESFTESLAQIKSSLTEKFGFDEKDIRIQFGRGPDQPEPKGFKAHGRATKDEIATEIDALVDQSTAEDLVWVFVISHTYYDGKSVFINVPDTDPTHHEFVASFKKLKAKQSAFFICTPVSGYFIKGLSQPNRVVVTSTEADYETNGSIFHTALADAMKDISPDLKFDIDKDGRVSLVDLYVKATQNLAEAYLTSERPLYPTEHPNFDDNGDGRGSEIQVSYLTPEQGGREKQPRIIRRKSDGKIASQIALPFVSKPAEAKPEEPGEKATDAEATAEQATESDATEPNVAESNATDTEAEANEEKAPTDNQDL